MPRNSGYTLSYERIPLPEEGMRRKEVFEVVKN
jgi:hypothetical protein